MKFNIGIEHNTSYMYHSKQFGPESCVARIPIGTLINVHAYFYNVIEFMFHFKYGYRSRDG